MIFASLQPTQYKEKTKPQSIQVHGDLDTGGLDAGEAWTCPYSAPQIWDCVSVW